MRGAASAIVLFAAIQVAISEASAAEMPRFYLCQSFIEAASLAHSEREPGQWFVDIKLTSIGTPALAEFTRTHLGAIVELLVGSSLVLEVQVRTTVDSGRIRSNAQAKPSAEALVELLASPPSAPCGLQRPAA